jgi:hypothetical protein
MNKTKRTMPKPSSANVYKGVLKKKQNIESYDFNDLLHELKGNNLSRLTPYINRCENITKRTVKNYLELEIDKINNTDQFL